MRDSRKREIPARLSNDRTWKLHDITGNLVWSGSEEEIGRLCNGIPSSGCCLVEIYLGEVMRVRRV